MTELKIDLNDKNILFTSEDTKSILFQNDGQDYLLVKLDVKSDGPDNTIKHIENVMDDFVHQISEKERETHADHAIDNMDDAFKTIQGAR